MSAARRTLILLPLLVAASWQAAQACPGCQAVVAERTFALSGPLAAGFYGSILVLLAVPFALVGGLTWVLVRAARRHAALMEVNRHGA